ncbi:uncharacterized protein [Cherax quadricarinatus]|uniref:uncharacterized protein n=1 Tax=Cherax quadricarinatus TaxID=27406 RepID=UPI00387E8CDB
MASITKEEHNGFRFIKALNQCGRGVLYNTLCWGTPHKPANVKLDDYLGTLDEKSTANYSKLTNNHKKFDNIQKELINKNPDGSEFDLTLLYRCIKLACEDVASFNDKKWITPSTEMEYYITEIKSMRNNALHSTFAFSDRDYLKNMEDLRKVLSECLKTSGVRYKRDEDEVEEKIKEMNGDLDHIMQEILGREEILACYSVDMKYLMINDSCDQLTKSLQNITYINPVSFIMKDLRLKVDQIFVDIEINQGKRRDDGKHADYRNLLQFHQTTAPSSSSVSQQHCTPARPQVLLLEGLAGSGKTTLVKLVTEEWTQGNRSNIKGLDSYELLLWVQCRDPTMKTYQDLLDHLIPDVSTKFRNFLPRLMKLCKVLIVVDGLDELNESSRNLVSSLLYEFRNSPFATFICTSRPEKVDMFISTIPEAYDVTNAEIRGISKEKMPEFVRRTHQAITNLTNSKRSTEDLVKKLMKVEGVQEHLRLPMNLTFFVYIWDQAPDELDIMTITQTDLYHEIHHLCQGMLLDRLSNCPQTKAMPERNLKFRIQEILRLLYITSLECLSREQLTLEEEAVERLLSACNKHDLPYEEILSAFLSLKSIWTFRGIEKRYSAPHKGIQDFFSALHIVMTLQHQLKTSTLPVLCMLPQPSLVSCQPSATLTSPFPTPALPTAQSTWAQPTSTTAPPVTIRGVLEQSVGTAGVDMTKFHNVLVHVAGLLHVLLNQVPEAIAHEIVHLVHQSGMRDIDKWLDFLENTRCNDNIAKAIAPFINNDNIKVVDHRVESYKSLLSHLRPSKVIIDITGDPADLPVLLDLLAILTCHNHRCICLQLHHHYSHDATPTSDDILQRVQPP